MNVEREIVLKLMDRMAEIEVGSTKKDAYEIEGKRVPRVTEVLSAMLHKDSLMNWANGLGWKRISYRAFMKEAADKGTYAHMAVESFLKEGHFDLDNIKKWNIKDPAILSSMTSCLMGFEEWWDKIHREHLDVSIVFIEETMIHPYFGGTCDLLLKIDGKYVLVDFKTSNHMNYSYALQLAAYRFLLKELKQIDISSCMVLQLSKTDDSYREYRLDLENNKDHLNFIEDCEKTFLTLVAAFKMRMLTTEEYYNVFDVKRWDS